MDESQHLIFRRGRRWYAAPVSRSFEVLEVGNPVRVPGAASQIRGVISHRGEVVPVIELASPESEGNARRALLLRTSGGPLGVSLSEVKGLEAVQLPPIEDAPEVETELEGSLRGPIPHDGNELWVLDPERLYTFLCRR